ncbi:MAG: tetratricopeptide repeat protein [Arenimonas sp.]
MRKFILSVGFLLMAGTANTAFAGGYGTIDALMSKEIKDFLATDDGRKYYWNSQDNQSVEDSAARADKKLKKYYTLFNKGEYDPAFKALEPIAIAGDRQAQAELASMYVSGFGAPYDMATAIMWYEKSAAQGNLKAMSTLGEIYYSPESGFRNLEKAHAVWEKCALRLRKPCVLSLAILLQDQRSKHYDQVKATAWFDIAVDQRVPGALEYRDGLIVKATPADIEKIRTEKARLIREIVSIGRALSPVQK